MIGRVRLKFKPLECAFFKGHLQYLKHLISGERICPLKEKVVSLVNLVPPTDVTDTRHSIGLA